GAAPRYGGMGAAGALVVAAAPPQRGGRAELDCFGRAVDPGIRVVAAGGLADVEPVRAAVVVAVHHDGRPVAGIAGVLAAVHGQRGGARRAGGTGDVGVVAGAADGD